MGKMYVLVHKGDITIPFHTRKWRPREVQGTPQMR